MTDTVNRSINIFVESGQAEAAYNRLVKKEKELKDELQKATNPKQIAALKRELDKLQEPIDRARRKFTGELKPSIADLQGVVKKLGEQLKRTSQNDANFDKLRLQVKAAKLELIEAKKAADDLNQSLGKQSGGAMAAFKGVGAVELLKEGWSMVKQFGKAVMDTTSEFQKFEAILRNTLGSDSLAKKALSDITAFAAETPFGVQELTDSFVKLANRGFVPTVTQLRQLGDIASSTGKSFDQLAEALLDAQTGEFERLKEFGIRAKKEGDKVQFTFKGVKTEVANTEEAIRNYITSLGDAEGVSGSMAAISETLGGQISNLGDSWDQMLVTVGKGTGSAFSGAIKIINDAINDVNEFMQQLQMISKYDLGENDGPLPFLSSLFGQNDSEKAANNIKQFQQGLDANFTDALEKLRSGKDSFSGYLDAMKERMLQPALAAAAKRGLAGEKKALLEAFDEFGKQVSQQFAKDYITQNRPKDTSETAEEKKAREKREKDAEKAADEFAKLMAELAKKARELQFYDMPQLTQDLERIDQFYDALEVRARGNAEALKRIEELRQKENFLVVQAYQRKEAEERLKLSKEEAEKRKQLDLKRLQEQAKLQQELAEELAKKADEELGEKGAAAELNVLKAKGRARLDAVIEQLNLQEQIEIKAAEGKEQKIALIQEQYRQKRRQAEIDATLQTVADITAFTSEVIGALDNFFAMQADQENAVIERDRKANDVKKANYQKQLDKKQISQQEFNKKVADDQAALDKKERELKIKQFNRDKAMNIGKAIINTAQGVLQALSSFPPPASFILAAIVGALGAVQIASIARQKPPEFAIGGVLPGPSHSEGGMPILNPKTGQKVAEVEGGEPILSKATYRNNKPLVDALLHSSMHQGGRAISPKWFHQDYRPINVAGIKASQQSVKMFENGGMLPTSVDNNRLEQLIGENSSVMAALSNQIANGIPAYTLVSQNEKAQNRLNEIRSAATMK